MIMKDNISLIAAVAGGFMLSVALSSILQGTPVAASGGETNLNRMNVTFVSLKESKTRESRN
jgi:hypothetical protein